ncbi:MAG: MerR family transcriptional regulator [Lachnospiraceae bacterium]|nr:MerR family transcriptional regulator [Lachnospiraceae bacterium]
MDKKMTSGEIAKKAGVSQKAVRLYDEKGLLKPTDYSEGNYRLYDKAALQILEKIVALKQIGFSLEEIRDNLTEGKAKNVEDALQIQLKTMEEKRYQIDKVIAAIRRTLERKDGSIDWDDVANIVQNVGLDQKADERHWDALAHTGQEEDWYVKIFKSLNIVKGEKILDLGCGFSKLWRNNWTDIPQDTTIFGYDIHGSWADNFDSFLTENKNALPDGVSISITFSDLEDASTWDRIHENEKYGLIIAHYLYFQLKNEEALIRRASQVLSEDGFFSCTGGSVSKWHYFFKDILTKAGVKTDFIDEILQDQIKERNELQALLEKYFSAVESVPLSNTWHYSDADELFEKLLKTYEAQDKLLTSDRTGILDVFRSMIKEQGEIAVKIDSQFWHCYK